MREFFKGWQRKTGCIVLVIACVLASAWVGSYVHDWFDVFGMPIGSSGGYFGPCKVVKVWQADLVMPRHQISVPIPYWPIVMVLTLLSAFLLLWTPRPKAKTA